MGLAERDSAATGSIASTSATPTPMGTATLDGSAPSVRERRSSRGSEEREIRIRRDLTYMMDNNARRSSASRNSEEERRGVRERSRRRERERRDRLDRLESLDCDHPLQEVDPFIGKHCLNQRVKILDPNQVYDTINLGRRIDVLAQPNHTKQRREIVLEIVAARNRNGRHGGPSLGSQSSRFSTKISRRSSNPPLAGRR